MRQYVSSLVVVLLGIACGGTTDTGDEGSAGNASGGTGTAGNHQGGSSTAGAAGKASAGSNSGGSSAGSVGTAGAGGAVIGHAGTSNGGTSNGGTGAGGTSSGGTGSGGTGTVNPKCPAHVPMGACSADDANVSCQYEPGSGCLCYPSAPGTYTPCQKVDPTCVYVAPAAAPAPPSPPADGTGGVTAKIAAPPHEVCSCFAQMWTCNYGI